MGSSGVIDLNVNGKYNKEFGITEYEHMITLRWYQNGGGISYCISKDNAIGFVANGRVDSVSELYKCLFNIVSNEEPA